jgi:hypothetical protein
VGPALTLLNFKARVTLRKPENLNKNILIGSVKIIFENLN